MGRAEAGSTKDISNRMKQKGLTRLRWYCEICQKANRDQNGFKCHVASESHQRNMLAISQNAGQEIETRSRAFQSEFLNLLRTSHRGTWISANKFYNQVIQDRYHTHMTATKWNNLTLFVHHLGREGLCRVRGKDDDSDGSAASLEIQWIDNSPEELRRREANEKAERMKQSDEERQQRMLDEQVRRGQAERAPEVEIDESARELKRVDGENVKLNFNFGKPAQAPTASNETQEKAKEKPKNVFSAKKNPLAGNKKSSTAEPSKKMSEMERIMKEEQDKKRKWEANGTDTSKRIKM